MAYTPGDAPIRAARHALSAAERLSARRQVAAAARAQAQALQIKAVVAISCVLVGGLGLGVYSASQTKKANISQTKIAPLQSQGLDSGIGEITVPSGSKRCRKLHFDNRTGIVFGESTVSCGSFEAQVTPGGPSRAQAIMNAFRGR
jgi:hypothetical protein